MRVTDVAARLGVSVSTAHRLLGMLVYRDFAEQLPDRRYAAGPVLRRARCSRRRSPGCARSPCRTCAGWSTRWGRRRTSWSWPGRTSGSSRRSRATRCCGSATAPAGRCRRISSSGGKAVLATLDADELAAVLDALDEAAAARVAAGAAHGPAPGIRGQRPGDRGGADRGRGRRPARRRVRSAPRSPWPRRRRGTRRTGCRSGGPRWPTRPRALARDLAAPADRRSGDLEGALRQAHPEAVDGRRPAAPRGRSRRPG